MDNGLTDLAVRYLEKYEALEDAQDEESIARSDLIEAMNELDVSCLEFNGKRFKIVDVDKIEVTYGVDRA